MVGFGLNGEVGVDVGTLMWKLQTSAAVALALLMFSGGCGGALVLTDGGSESTDGGGLDAGLDGGMRLDAGLDGGLDAGTDGGAQQTADSGPPPGCQSDGVCPEGQYCDDEVWPPACATSPIHHVIIFVKENHTFDNYFGSFPGAEGTATAVTSNGPIPVTEAPDVPPHDLCHEHSCALTDLDHGKMDGWSLDGGSDIASDLLAYQQYYEQDIPNYWQYARNFTLGDHFFSGDLGPSFPGHLMALAAQSAWAIGNPSDYIPWTCDAAAGTTLPVMNPTTGQVSQVFPCFDIPSLPDLLPPTLDWRFYGTNYTSALGGVWTMFNAIRSIHDSPVAQSKIVSEANFDADVASGSLPAVTWVVNQDQDDEHPSYCISVCHGENYTVDRINSVMQSPLWQDTAILILWDDFGGWYDHVPPPVTLGPAASPYGWGMRVPLLVVSPYAKPGYIFKHNASQASVIHFTERVLGIHKSLHALDPAAQDSAVDDLFGAFDFHQPPNPPLVLPDRSCVSFGIPLLCSSSLGGSG